MKIDAKHCWLEHRSGAYYINIYINDDHHFHYKTEHIMSAVRIRKSLIGQEFTEVNTYIKEDETYFRVNANLTNNESEIITVHTEKMNIHLALRMFEEAISEKNLY